MGEGMEGGDGEGVAAMGYDRKSLKYIPFSVFRRVVR